MINMGDTGKEENSLPPTMDQQRMAPSSESSTPSSTASSSTLSSPLMHPAQSRQSPIGPPTPLAISSFGRINTTYSLFEPQATTAHPSWDWLPSQVLRKHSVDLDGTDYQPSRQLSTKICSNAGFWRRASAPNTATQNTICAVCQRHCSTLPQPCGFHLVCQTCMETLFPFTKRKSTHCPLCQVRCPTL